MIAEEKRRALLATIEQMQDEVVFEQIAATVQELLGQQRGKAGFLKGSVDYLVKNWDAPLTDWKHLDE